jgi:hypothetical protein
MTSIMAHAGLMLNAWDADAQALFDRFDSNPPGTVKDKINTLIITLKEEGIWELLDSLYVPAKTGEQAGGLCDWVRATKAATLAGGASWDNDTGLNSDGNSGSYVNLDFIPSTMGVNFTLHNASHGAYISGASNQVSADYWGGNSTSNNHTRFTRSSSGGTHFSLVNGQLSSGAFLTAAFDAANKLISCQRSGSGTNTSTFFYVDGVNTGTPDTEDANSLSAATLYALARNNNGSATATSNGKLAMWYAGAALSEAQMVAFNAAVEVYLA